MDWTALHCIYITLHQCCPPLYQYCTTCYCTVSILNKTTLHCTALFWYYTALILHFLVTALHCTQKHHINTTPHFTTLHCIVSILKYTTRAPQRLERVPSQLRKFDSHFCLASWNSFRKKVFTSQKEQPEIEVVSQIGQKPQKDA